MLPGMMRSPDGELEGNMFMTAIVNMRMIASVLQPIPAADATNNDRSARKDPPREAEITLLHMMK
jgi:hypothetical protein